MNEDINLWIKSLKPGSGKGYGRYLKRPLHGENPETVVKAIKSEAKTNTFDTYDD